MSEMKLTGTKAGLSDLLGRAAQAAERRAGVRPAVTGVKLDATDGKLVTTTTDSSVQLALSLVADDVVIEEEGSCLAPAHLLGGYVSKMPDGKVSLEVADGHIKVKGDGPEYKLRLLEVDEFPKVAQATGDSVEVDGEAFFAAVAKIAPAVGRDQSMVALTGVLVDVVDGQTHLVATDSYRMGVAKVDTAKTVGGTTGQVLIPASGGLLSKVEKALGVDDLKVTLDDRSVTFTTGAGSATLRLIEGRFPAWAGLMPDETPIKVEFSIDELRAAIGRIDLMAEGHVPMKLTFGGDSFTAGVDRSDVGAGSEKISCEYTGPDDLVLGVNTRYLSEGLAVLDGETAILQIVDSHKPALLSAKGDDGFTYVVMPIRL